MKQKAFLQGKECSQKKKKFSLQKAHLRLRVGISYLLIAKISTTDVQLNLSVVENKPTLYNKSRSVHRRIIFLLNTPQS